MAYDEGLAQRVREALSDRRGLSEKKMFGGLCFLVNGNMACGIVRDELMVRIGPAAYDHALAEPEAREMDFTGRALKGFVYVESDALQDDGRAGEMGGEGRVVRRDVARKIVVGPQALFDDLLKDDCCRGPA